MTSRAYIISCRAGYIHLKQPPMTGLEGPEKGLSTDIVQSRINKFVGGVERFAH